jgi:hypothetical protein
VFAAAAAVHAANLVAVLSGNLMIGFGGGRGGGFGGFGGLGGGRPGGFGGFGGGMGGGFSSITLPLTDLARSETVVMASAVGLSALLLVLLGAWAVVILPPSTQEPTRRSISAGQHPGG